MLQCILQSLNHQLNYKYNMQINYDTTALDQLKLCLPNCINKLKAKIFYMLINNNTVMDKAMSCATSYNIVCFTILFCISSCNIFHLTHMKNILLGVEKSSDKHHDMSQKCFNKNESGKT